MKVTVPSTVEEAPEVVRTTTGVPVFTVSVIAVALAVLKLLSVAMLAPIEFEPAFRAVVVQVAVRGAPGVSETLVHPAIGVVVPFNVVVKLTLPLGITPLFGVTVAVKVTEPFSGDVPVPDPVRTTTGVALATVSVIAVAVPVLKLVSLAMLAPMEFEPAFSRVVVQVATPLTTETAPHPEIVVVLPLSVVVKATVPVGIMPLFGVTVAVRVTDPFTVGVAFVVFRTTVGVTLVTVWATVADFAVKLVSAARFAVIVYDPAVSALVTQVATPAVGVTFVQPAIATGDPAPRVEVKLTVPDGVMPVVGVTFAVNVRAVLTGTEAFDVPTLNPGVACVIVWPTVADCAVKFESAVRFAVIVYDPAVSALVTQVAAPAVTVTAVQPAMATGEPAPRVEVKLTVPVGVMPEVGVTCAVNVSEVLTGTEAFEVPTVNPGVAAVTVWATVADWAVKFVSAARFAVIV